MYSCCAYYFVTVLISHCYFFCPTVSLSVRFVSVPNLKKGLEKPELVQTFPNAVVQVFYCIFPLKKVYDSWWT